MPLRLELLKKSWSTVELPILPFLAPRVFQPWPCNSRTHSAIQTPRKNIHTTKRKYYNAPRASNDGAPSTVQPADMLEISTKQASGIEYGHFTPVIEAQNGPGGSPPSSMSAKESNLNSAESRAGHDEFTKKYREVWGGMKRSSDRDSQREEPIMSFTAKSTGKPREESRFGKTLQDEHLLSAPVGIHDQTPEWPASREEEKPARLANFESSRKPRRVTKRNANLYRGKTRSEYLSRPKGLIDSKHITYSKPSLERRVRQPNLVKPVYIRPALLAMQRTRIHFANKERIGIAGIERARSKWVRFIPGPQNKHGIFSFWHGQFAAISHNRRFKKGKARKPLLRQQSDPAALKELQNLLFMPASSFEETWLALPHDRRIKMWPELILSALEYRSSKALEVLSMTYQEPFPPPYAVADSLEFIVQDLLTDQDQPTDKTALNLHATIVLLFRRGSPNHLQLSQELIKTLLRQLPDVNLESLYTDLVDMEQELHPHTLMHFSSRFTKSGNTRLGFEIFKDIVDHEGVNINSPSMMSLCTTILSLSTTAVEHEPTRFEKFQFMLAHGIEPNVITYNTLLTNVLSSGDPETAWQIHDLMLENDVAPDAATYSVFLNDAKRRMDSDAIKTTMSYLRSRGIMGPYLVTDMLHTILLLHLQESRGFRSRTAWGQQMGGAPVFYRMLDVYSEHFGTGVLRGLIPQFQQGNFSPMSFPKPERGPKLGSCPPTPTLVIMLCGLMNDLDAKSLKHLYEHICQLVFRGDRIAREIMNTTYLWNVFLLAFGKHQELLDDCPRILGTMLTWSSAPIVKQTNPSPLAADEQARVALPRQHRDEQPSARTTDEISIPETSTPLSQYAADSYRATTRNTAILRLYSTSPSPSLTNNLPTFQPFTAPSPDIFTWSILLRIFTQRSQPRAAEKVLEAMTQRGISPNEVTWNSLIRGYSELQDAGMVADAVVRMETAGFQAGDITMKAMGKIKDRRRLGRGLERK